MKKYKNKLKYRSWHRGTKEADLFLGSFFTFLTISDEGCFVIGFPVTGEYGIPTLANNSLK